ncbi:MAG: LCP family protein, partial [Thermomicrobiales bacterium]|nr:LCP family protein [Thermomicrobiales bacterium]
MNSDAPVVTESFDLPRSSQPERGSRNKRRSKKRKWYNRWPVRIAVLLVLLLGLAGGIGVWRLDRTINDLNAISTVPAQIQDQTAQELDGTPNAIVTPPALPTANAGPAPTIVIPSYSGSSPGGPVRQTAVALAQSGAIGEVFTSNAATPPAGDGSPVAEATPVIDGEGQAEQMMAGGMTFDTGPAQTAVAAAEELKKGPTSTPSGDSSYVFEQTAGSLQTTADTDDDDDDEGGGILDGLRGVGENVQDAVDGAAVAVGLKDPKTDPMTILIMGVDARPGQAIDIGVRPDALMVLRLDPESGTCRGLAIPRDSLVELPGYGETKINHALMLGGIPYEELVVELYLGIEIDHYALIDFTGFEDLVDAVGG